MPKPRFTHTVTDGSLATLLVDDDHGQLEVELVVSDLSGDMAKPPLILSPRAWLGPHHPSLEEFRWYMTTIMDEGPLEQEALARTWIEARVAGLLQDLWAVFTKVVVEDEQARQSHGNP